MPDLSDLLAQKAELEKQIEALGRVQRSAVIAQVKALMADYSLTVADLSGKVAASRKGSKVASKYRDPQSGNAWSGRGRQPKWITAAIGEGKKLEDFAV